MPIIVGIESKKNAEKSGKPRAYLARLESDGHGGVARVFAPKIKALNTGNRRSFALEAHPGQVFEAQRWDWEGAGYVGGVVWFRLDGAGEVIAIERDEALFIACKPQIEVEATAARDELTLSPSARPIPPFGVSSRRVDSLASTALADG